MMAEGEMMAEAEMMEEEAPPVPVISANGAAISISGSMNHDFGFGSYVGGAMSADDFHQEIDAELHFKATGTTDGGLTVTAVMELDADSGAGVDESNLTIAGGFGSIILGAQDNAANRHGNKGIGGGYGGGGYYDCGAKTGCRPVAPDPFRTAMPWVSSLTRQTWAASGLASRSSLKTATRAIPLLRTT